jgi:hypothetical protein
MPSTTFKKVVLVAGVVRDHLEEDLHPSLVHGLEAKPRM